jgi:hypothetical protein
MTHNGVGFSESLKVTVPVGSVEPVTPGTMTALKLTCWLTVEAAGTEFSVTVVVGAPTVWSVVPEPDRKFASPL